MQLWGYAHWFRFLQRLLRTAKTAAAGYAYSSTDGQNFTVKAVECAPAAAKARSAQVLRNSPRTMPLSSSWSQDTLNPFSTRKNKLFPKLTYYWLHTTSDFL